MGMGMEGVGIVAEFVVGLAIVLLGVVSSVSSCVSCFSCAGSNGTNGMAVVHDAKRGRLQLL